MAGEQPANGSHTDFIQEIDMVDILFLSAALLIILECLYLDLRVAMALKNEIDAMECKLMEMRK